MNIEILFQDDTDLAEYEAENKGYRSDVVVRVNGKTYKLFVTTMVRLQQDFESDVKHMGYYCPDRNMIIVAETSKSQIEHTIKELYKGGCFDIERQFFFSE